MFSTGDLVQVGAAAAAAADDGDVQLAVEVLAAEERGSGQGTGGNRQGGAVEAATGDLVRCHDGSWDLKTIDREKGLPNVLPPAGG